MLLPALFIVSCNARPQENYRDEFGVESRLLSEQLDEIHQIADSLALLHDSATRLRDSLITEVDCYIKWVAPRSRMTGENIVDNCLENSYDISLLLSQAHLETHFGTSSRNVFGIVGQRHSHPDEYVPHYITLMTSKYIIKRTPEQLIRSNFSMENNRRAKYAENPNYGREVGNIRRNIIENTDIHNIWLSVLDIRQKIIELNT